MIQRSHTPAVLALLAAAGAAGLVSACASTGGRSASAVGLEAPGTVTRAEIRASGARTVWQALRFTTTLHVRDDPAGRPGQLLHRGRNSISLENTPLLVMDGAIVSDYRHLDRVPASDLLSIRVRSPSSASAEYGGLARAGVVELDTRSR